LILQRFEVLNVLLTTDVNTWLMQSSDCFERHIVRKKLLTVSDVKLK